MGENIATETGITNSLRRRVGNWLMPVASQRLLDLENELFDTALKLQRATQQVNQLTNDKGLFKPHTWANLAIGDYNPEEIGFDEYKKMLNYDAQVVAGFDLIQMGVLMKPWRIIHRDQKIADSLTRSLDRMRQPSIREAMKEMLKAVVYGFSTTEIVFDDYQGYWVPRRTNGLKTFDPEYITFYTDDFGNLLKIEEKIGGGTVLLPIDRTLVWTHEKEWGNWYGKSLLRGCYKNWFIKDAMLKFANIAYERFGSPILLGTATSIKEMVQISDAIEHLYARSQAVIVKKAKDDPTAIDVIESKRTEMPFDRYIRYQDEMILRRMLIGQNVFEGGGGTYGPKVPLDLLMMRFEDMRLELTGIMNELVQRTTDLNWAVDDYPRFEFAPLTTLDQTQIVQKIYDAIDREIVDKEEPWIREELNFPAKETSESTSEEESLAAARHLPGRYLVGSHARWLASGYKTMIVASKPYRLYHDREIYIVGDDGIFGTMVEGQPKGPYEKDIQHRWQGKHHITQEEWNKWWPEEEEFWIWSPKVLKQFDPPLNYKVPRGSQVYIRKVIPDLTRKEEGW